MGTGVGHAGAGADAGAGAGAGAGRAGAGARGGAGRRRRREMTPRQTRVRLQGLRATLRRRAAARSLAPRRVGRQSRTGVGRAPRTLLAFPRLQTARGPRGLQAERLPRPLGGSARKRAAREEWALEAQSQRR
jgi:hypothetical protein